MTLLPDAALRVEHLNAALDHIQKSVICTEGMAASGVGDVDQLYRDRAELRHIVETLNEIIDRGQEVLG